MDSRRYYPDKKFCGFPVEKTCNIFAIINLVLVGACVITCAVTEGYLVTRFVFYVIHNNFSEFSSWMFIWLIYAVVCVFTATNGIFAVLLLRGLRRNNPSLVMAYLIFGLIQEVSMIFSTAIYIIIVINFEKCRPNCAFFYLGMALEIIICVVYGFILCLVRSAYVILSSRTKRNSENGQTVLYMFER